LVIKHGSLMTENLSKIDWLKLYRRWNFYYVIWSGWHAMLMLVKCLSVNIMMRPFVALMRISFISDEISVRELFFGV
jgi:hypothetical protein